MKNYYLAMKRSYKSILIGIVGGYLATLINLPLPWLLGALLLNLVVFTLGTLANTYFAIIASGYIATMLMIYFLGTKIKDLIINVGYIWISKWTVFIIFLTLTGVYLPDAFLYSLLMFIVFNITINPSDFIKEKGAQ